MEESQVMLNAKFYKEALDEYERGEGPGYPPVYTSSDFSPTDFIAFCRELRRLRAENPPVPVEERELTTLEALREKINEWNEVDHDCPHLVPEIKEQLDKLVAEYEHQIDMLRAADNTKITDEQTREP